MSIQARLTTLGMTLGLTWIAWILLDLAAVGVAGALDRALYLARTSAGLRRLGAAFAGRR